MSAPKHAVPLKVEYSGIILDGWGSEKFECLPENGGCGHTGYMPDLLGVDPDENTTMWCPKCRRATWTWK